MLNTPLSSISKGKNRLAETLKGSRGSFTAVALFSFFINLLMLAAPLYMLQVFDRVLGGGSVDTLIFLSGIVIAAFIALAGLEAIRGRVMVSLGVWMERQLTDSALERHLLLASQKKTDESAQGLRDVAIIRNFMTGPSVFPILDAPWIPVFLFVIFLLHPTLGWIATAGAALLLLLAIINDLVSRNALHRSGATSIAGLHNAEAAVRNADSVIAMGFAKNLVGQWSKSNQESLDDMATASRRSGTVSAISRFLRLSLQIAMTGTGAWLVLGGELTAGGMIASSILLGRGLGPVDQAIGCWKNAIAARSAYNRLQGLMGDPAEASPDVMELPAPTGAISVENVIYSHNEAGMPILRNLSFKLEPGESLGIAGPTAAGKSTLARLLVGLAAPQAGNLRLDGADISQWPKENLGQYLGYLPQEVELFEGTVRDNIGRHGKANALDVVKAAQMARVHDLILQLDHGYETQIGSNGAALSGGQRQRIALARALFSDPRFVVLDEPNASLDFSGDNALVGALDTLSENKTTTVIITHRPSILRHVDKILILHSDGRTEFGPCNEMFTKITGVPEGKRNLKIREVTNA
ncbi:type I secretion system permease/ATPase [Kiloniella sp.]|uniref:type I secretion system permease/ATPase n=1 Tax=Kiloniella sp. TaxID=1938587 RepID=UPI003B01CE0E